MRRLSAAVGLAAVGFGLTSVALRETFGFSLSYAFVTLVGALAMLQGVRYAAARRRSDVRETETGDPELRYRVPTPGDEFDEQMVDAAGWSLRSVSRRRDVRTRLRQATLDALVVHDHCNPAEAEARIESGTWTDDAIAATFLSDDAPAPPLRTRLWTLFRRESQFSHRVRRTVDAVVSLQEGDR